jgi:GTP-binding protein
VVFVDLPGYGFAKVPLALREQWKGLVEGYLGARRQLRGVVLLVDVRRGVEEEERMLLDFLQAVSVPVVLAVTKVDKLGRSERLRRLRDLTAGSPFPGVRAVVGVSALSGEGIAALRREIDKLAHSEPRGGNAAGIVPAGEAGNFR